MRTQTGWRGVLLIAVTYIYFLIFAQFGFLRRLDDLGVAGAHLKLVLGAMAAGGILVSLVAPRVGATVGVARRLRLALAGCASAALLTLLPLATLSGIAVSLLIGLSLGLLTVTLVTNLDLLLGPSYPLLKVGLGTGLGYLCCNLPWLFRATPAAMALTSAAICCFGAVLISSRGEYWQVGQRPSGTRISVPFSLLLVWFTALIWLDSAAFFIIQSSPALKSGTWEGAAHLWRNGALHLIAAVAAAFFIARRGVAITLLAAFGCLGGACLVLLHPERAALAAVLYPVGVSLYSVALVAAPTFLMGDLSRAERGRKAGVIYAVAGWMGSALGIGMGQNLHHVPPAFVAVAAVLFVVPWLWRLQRQQQLQAAAVLGSLLVAAGLQHLLASHAGGGTAAAETEIARGRKVYIAEGCIHCHSQYVRPHSAADMLMWGPSRDVEAIRREKPPLIGNRRQGPDLSEVGSRRSPLWLRMHFVNPRDVSYSSIMPTYAHLFRDDHDGAPISRGDALIAYVASLRTPESAEHLRQISSTWKPASATASTYEAGAHLFGQNCGTCHLAAGRARTRWAASFRRLPPNLSAPGLLYVPGTEAGEESRTERLAQIVKFGLPGTDMPGHEYLPDVDVQSIAMYVSGITSSVPPASKTALAAPPGR